MPPGEDGPELQRRDLVGWWSVYANSDHIGFIPGKWSNKYYRPIIRAGAMHACVTWVIDINTFLKLFRNFSVDHCQRTAQYITIVILTERLFYTHAITNYQHPICVV